MMPGPRDPCPLCTTEPRPRPCILLHPMEPEPGQWCDDCALPSAMLVPIRATCEHGWPAGMLAPSVLVCTDCGRQDTVPPRRP